MPRKTRLPISRNLKKPSFTKRTIVSFVLSFVLFFLAFSCISLGSISIGNDWVEHFSKTLGSELVVCKVTSNNSKDNYRKFFSYSDDLAGREIKSSCDTYVYSTGSNETKPATIKVGETKEIGVDTTMLYTTWSFHKFNFGLKTFTDKETKNLTGKEIYINQSLADEISKQTGLSLNNLIEKEITMLSNGSSLDVKIIDIITNLSDQNLGPHLNKNVIIGSYHYLNSKFSNMEYVFVMHGSSLTKNYCMKYIEGAINKLAPENMVYESNYLKLSNNKFIDVGYNNSKNNLKQFYIENSNRILSLFFIVPLLIWFSFIMLLIFNIIGKECIYSVYGAGLLFSVIGSATNPSITLANAQIFILTRIGALILFSFLFCTMAIYYLFKKDYPERMDCK